MNDYAALLEENRQLKEERAARQAEAYAKRDEKIRAATLPLRLTVQEFGSLVRLCDESVRRLIRSRQIEAYGQPFLIPRRELEKLGVNQAEAAEVFRQRQDAA